VLIPVNVFPTKTGTTETVGGIEGLSSGACPDLGRSADSGVYGAAFAPAVPEAVTIALRPFQTGGAPFASAQSGRSIRPEAQ
jgi:hypothetical protein